MNDRRDEHPLPVGGAVLRVWRTIIGDVSNIFIIIGATTLAVLLLMNQPLHPQPWFDEGLNAGAAAMIARAGVYALPDADSPRISDPAIQTGPIVLIPIALVYKLLTPSIALARLVIVPFALIAFVTFAVLARRLTGPWSAILATVCMMAGAGGIFNSFVPMGRMVLGEVAALAYLLLGLLIWIRALRLPSGQQAWTYWLFSGLAWGLAMTTKSQVLILVPVALATLFVLDRIYYRQLKPAAIIVSGSAAVGCAAAWYGAQFVIAGDRAPANLNVLREGFQLHIAAFEPHYWRNALGVLWRSAWWLWGAPALLWGLRQAWQRTEHGLTHASVLIFPSLSLLWFTVFSIGWERYAFYFTTLSFLWLGGILSDGWQHLRRSIGARRWFLGLYIAMVTGLFVWNGLTMIAHIVQPKESGYAAMVQFLQRHISPEAIIATWEWEIAVEAHHRLRHPQTSVTNAATRFIMSRRRPPDDLYDAFQTNPEYILVGAFVDWVGVYHEELRSERVQKIAENGIYRLYRVIP
ncbi:ArnT family glycosyltransferase [Roseiflexus sp.]|uniref:ArnT family glycosyltransferase n=1 Tax=Roseiflexus sp. TaxID=2562120 RepID=UPI00398B4FE7